jgi:hypothetical protein
LVWESPMGMEWAHTLASGLERTLEIRLVCSLAETLGAPKGQAWEPTKEMALGRTLAQASETGMACVLGCVLGLGLGCVLAFQLVRALVAEKGKWLDRLWLAAEWAYVSVMLRGKRSESQWGSGKAEGWAPMTAIL